MKFSITGHLGLIGSALKKTLEDAGNECVFEIDTRGGKDVRTDMPLTCSIKPDIMFHLAASCKINASISSPKYAFGNVKAAHEVLEFCRRNGIKKIVAFSSSRVLNEEKNPYTASKVYLEELCKAYSKCYGIDYIVIRPSTVYGPFDDKTHRLIDIWIRGALNGEDLKIYGDPDTKTLDFTFIDDFIDGVMLALNNGEWNKEYNISGGRGHNLNELAKFIIEETHSDSKISICPEEIQQPQDVSVDISGISRIGYSPKVGLEEGARRTIKFYIDNSIR